MADPSRDHAGDFIVPRFLLPDGEVECTVQPLAFGKCMLTAGPPGAGYYDRAWHYAGVTEVMVAVADWVEHYEDRVEPTGWFRAIDGTGRRRTDGDPDQEYIHW